MNLWLIFGLFVTASTLSMVLFWQNNQLRTRILSEREQRLRETRDANQNLLQSLSLQEAKHHSHLLQKDEQIQTLLDRLMAQSLSEYRAQPLTPDQAYDPEDLYRRSIEEGETIVDFSTDLQELGLVTGTS